MRAGQPAVRAVAAQFAEPRHRAGVTELIAVGRWPAGMAMRGGGRAMAGKTFVRTGPWPTRSRALATAKIAEAGVRLEQARTRKVPVIDETEMRRLIEGR